MTTGRINQVRSSPLGWNTLTTLTRPQVALRPCGTSPGTHIKFLQRYAMRNTANNQDLYNDPRAKDAQTSSRCVWKPFETQVLHALHAQLCDPKSHAQHSPDFKSLSLSLVHLLGRYSFEHLLQSNHKPVAHFVVVKCRATALQKVLDNCGKPQRRYMSCPPPGRGKAHRRYMSCPPPWCEKAHKRYMSCPPLGAGTHPDGTCHVHPPGAGKIGTCQPGRFHKKASLAQNGFSTKLFLKTPFLSYFVLKTQNLRHTRHFHLYFVCCFGVGLRKQKNMIRQGAQGLFLHFLGAT